MNSSNKRFRRWPRRLSLRWAACGLSLWLTALHPSARAQYTDSYQTNIISGVTSNWSGDYGVGSAHGADVLLIQNGGVLTDNNGYLVPSSNSVLVTDPNSVWSNGVRLALGAEDTSGNSLVISNGGLVVSSSGFIGDEFGIGIIGTGTSNSVLVTGPGSRWHNGWELYVGYKGGGNSLAINNGGGVDDGNGYLGFYLVGNNSVVVTDTGSVWTNSSNLYVGYSGAGNNLLIGNGGLVWDSNGVVGHQSSSSNNSVVVTDTGSVWNNSGTLTLGNNGAGNSLVISKGGALVSNNGSVGNTSSSNNIVLVTDTGSVWSNSERIYFGNTGAGNSLVISNGGQVVTLVHGTLGYGLSSSNNSAVVVGSGSVWNCGSRIRVGVYSPGNSLVISGGGSVFDNDGYLGGNVTNSASHNNSVLVSDSGSIWSNNSNTYVGYSGAANSLVISNGGLVISDVGIVGFYSSSSNNSVRLTDGAVWQNGTLHVGEQSSTNVLMVAGGSVLATNLIIGVASPTCDNLVQLDGGSVYVTNATANAVLEVRNGEFIFNGGVLQVDTLVITNACARFIRNGGVLSITTTNLDPNMSAVGDGIPNGWKQQYGLDPFDPNLANEDADGDGMGNLQEYLAGTDPTNNASSFRITSLVSTDHDVLVIWTMGSSKTNALQAAAGDASGSYTNAFADIFTVTNTIGTVTNYLDAGAATNLPARYYRVRLVP